MAPPLKISRLQFIPCIRMLLQFPSSILTISAFILSCHPKDFPVFCSIHPIMGALNYARDTSHEHSVTGTRHPEPLSNVLAHLPEVAGISRPVHFKYCLSPNIQLCFAKAKILNVSSKSLPNHSALSLRATRKTQTILRVTSLWYQTATIKNLHSRHVNFLFQGET